MTIPRDLAMEKIMNDKTQAAIATLHELNPVKTDAAIAQELKDEVRPLVEQLIALMAKARQHGMQLNYSIANNNFGQLHIADLHVVKLL